MESGGQFNASRLLQAWGWQPGKGLGKREDGITDYVRVRRPDGHAGVGLKKAADVGNWWERMYNNAAQTSQQRADHVEQSSASDSESASDSDAQPAAPSSPPPPYSGRFVSRGLATEQPLEADSSDDEDGHVSHEKLDLHSICGGASFGKFTGHFRPEGKFKRIQAQEARHRARAAEATAVRSSKHKPSTEAPVSAADEVEQPKKKHKSKHSRESAAQPASEPAVQGSPRKSKHASAADTTRDDSGDECNAEQAENKKKSKGTKRRQSTVGSADDEPAPHAADETSETAVSNKKKNKKTKRRDANDDADADIASVPAEDAFVEPVVQPKRKKNKKAE